MKQKPKGMGCLIPFRLKETNKGNGEAHYPTQTSKRKINRIIKGKVAGLKFKDIFSLSSIERRDIV